MTCSFSLHTAMALARAHGLHRAQQQLLVGAGRFADAIAATSANLEDAAAVVAQAPRAQRQALWLQVLHSAVDRATGSAAPLQPQSEGPAESAVQAAVREVVSRARSDLPLETALQHLPQRWRSQLLSDTAPAGAAPADVAQLLRRCVLEERMQLTNGAAAQPSAAAMTGARRHALGKLQQWERDAMSSKGAKLRAGACAHCRQPLSAPPPKGLPHGAQLQTTAVAACSSQ